MFSSLTTWFNQFFSMDGEPYKAQHDYHQKATGYLHQALECDEKSSILYFKKKLSFLIS